MENQNVSAEPQAQPMDAEQMQQRIEYLEKENQRLYEDVARFNRWWNEESEKTAKLRRKMEAVKCLIEIIVEP